MKTFVLKTPGASESKVKRKMPFDFISIFMSIYSVLYFSLENFEIYHPLDIFQDPAESVQIIKSDSDIELI